MLRAVYTLIFIWAVTINRDGYAQLPSITFEVITSKDGLPSNAVFSATRDEAGFMWFGTRQSPVRYDGVNFKSFTAYTTNFVTGIQADKNQNIWLSSDRSGVSKIDLRTLQMKQVAKSSRGPATSTGFFYIDVHGQGWYSDHYGINRIDLNTHQQKHYSLRQTNFVWLKGSFVEDHSGNLWVIGRDNGLFKYDRQQDTLICVLGPDGPDVKMKHVIMNKATVDDEGVLWIGTYNEGLLKFDPRTSAVEMFTTGRIDNQILAVEKGVDENGNELFWVGDSQGLGIFRPEQGRFYFFSAILPKKYEVNAIYRDRDGIVWTCTSDGVIKYHPQGNAIQVITIPPNVMNEALTVNVILQDTRPGYDHLFYLGMSNNLILKWDRHSNAFIKISLPTIAAEVRWMEQRDGVLLWIGTNRWDYERPGVLVYNLATQQFIKPAASLSANKFFSVPFFMYGAFDKARLLVGNSDEGIHVVAADKNEEVTPWPDSVMKNFVKNNNLINDMMLDSKGTLWIGCYKGLYYYDDAKKDFVGADPPKLPAEVDDRVINTLLEDHRGNIWAARWGSLTMTKTGSIAEAYGTKDGFNDREIKGLAEDANGNIWIGNYEGLYCLNRTSNSLVRFTMNDGLISNNTLDRIFLTKDKKELLIGQVYGFNLVKTEEVLKRIDSPPLVVNSFKIHQSELAYDFTLPIKLKPAQNVFSVDFVALNYRKQDDNQYAYYLEGFEKDWNYIGSKHIAAYTNLNPGKYTLHMKAGDAFGNWSDETLQMQVEVLPAFYQTIWFKILVSLVITALLYGLYQYRINQLLHLQKVRNSISADLHDELGSTLSGISIMGSLAARALPEQHTSRALVDRIMEDVRQISGSLDDIVWNISPKNDSLSSLIARMTRYASELFEVKQIAFKFDIPERLEEIKLSMEQRRNVYLIFKESVNNLVKYSKCTKAFLTIGMNRTHVHLIVKDNGIGFNPDTFSERNGIRNLRDRAKTLHGEISIQSIIGEGTTITLQFPVG